MRFNDRILIIDDGADSIAILEDLLQDHYTTRSARSGSEALEIALEFKPNLVLLDVMMPGLSGNEVCDIFRLNPDLREAKVVMVSALNEARDRLVSYEAGAVDFVTKPFDHKELMVKVKTWMHMACRNDVDAVWTEIDAMRGAIASALLKTASVRDVETGEHLIRMRIYSSAIAAQLSLDGPYRFKVNRTFRAQLYRASPLHDIGKVAIPDAILRKPGPLTPAEYEVVKRHTVVGAEILQEAVDQMPHADYLKMAVEVARHHHERFNGLGYPDGLAGTDIPLSARIVAVADVLDALTSKRVYKDAMSLDKAERIIAANSGTHYDPAIVQALQARLDIFRHIANRLAEREMVPS